MLSKLHAWWQGLSRGKKEALVLLVALIVIILIGKKLLRVEVLAACTGSSPTWTSTPDFASVQTCYNSAAAGDTINISAGTATWSSTLVITKKLIIEGAGKDATFINGGVTFFESNTTAYTRIGNMDIQGGQGSGGSMIQIRNAPTAFRVHHIRFSKPTSGNTRAITVAHQYATGQTLCAAGLIDHIDVVGESPFPGVLHGGCNSLTWLEPSAVGTANAVYIENSNFLFDAYVNGVGAALDGSYAGKAVFRYNTVKNTDIAAHGTEGVPDSRASFRSYEVYKNYFVNMAPTSSFGKFIMRGGTGVIFDNDFICVGGLADCNFALYLAEYRGDNSAAAGPAADDDTTSCEGDDVFDDNFVFGSGGHTGANGSATLTVTGTPWTTNQWVGYRVYNLNDPASATLATQANCQVTANTANTATCTLAEGTRNTWNSGDGYQFRTGWPCFGQIGRGQYTTIPGPSASEPLRMWNNRCTGPWDNCASGKVTAPTVFASTSGRRAAVTHIMSNRTATFPSATNDYVICTDASCARPGYTPYTYPHPLTKADP